MTYGELYDEIIARAFPGSIPPENMPDRIRLWLKRCQRMINRKYNFWFTLDTYAIATVASQRSYALPDNFKEIEKAYFTINGQTYTGDELGQIELDEHIKFGLLKDDSEVEYPTQFRVDGMALDLFPLPSSVRSLNIYYWKFLDVVPITPVATFAAYTDDISEYCEDAIINYVLSTIKLDQNEWQASMEYKQRYIEAIEDAYHEDNVRRSIPENKAPLSGSYSTGYALED